MSLSILQQLGIVFKLDSTDVRKGASEMATATGSIVDTLSNLQAKFNSLEGGKGDRFYVKGREGAMGVATANVQLAATYDQAFQAAVDYVSVLRDQATHFGSVQNSIVQVAQGLARTSGATGVLANSAGVLTARMFAARQSVSATSLALMNLDLVNYGISHNIANANWVQVLLRGPGKVVHAIEFLQKSLFGLNAPLHAIQKVIQTLASPAILTLAQHMLTLSDNPWARVLHHGLTTLAADFHNFGAATRTAFRFLMDGVFSGFGGLALLQRGFNTATASVQAWGRSMRDSGTLLGQLGASAAGAAAFILQIAAAVTGAVRAFLSFNKYLLLIGVGTATLAVKGLVGVASWIYRVGAAASNVTGLTTLAKGLTGVGTASKSVAADLAGVRQAGMATRMSFMELAGPVAIFGLLGGAIYGVTKGFAGGIEWANQTEQTAKGLEVMTGSAEAALDVLHKVKDWGKTTPFLIPNLNEAARDLMSYGVVADQIVPTLKTLGDVSGGNEERFKELVDIYGKLKSQGGALGLDQINQLASRAIPIWEELRNVTGKNETELRAMITAGQVGLPQLQQALKNMTGEGGKLNEGLARQTDTVLGQTGKLKENMGLLFQDIAQGWQKAFDTKAGLAQMSTAIGWVRSSFVPTIVAGFQIVANAFTAAQNFIIQTWSSIGPYITEAWSATWGFVVDIFSSAWGIVSGTFQAVWGWLSSFFGGDQLGIVSWTTTIQSALLVVSYAFQNWKDYVALAGVNAMYAITVFANEVIYTFTDRIPAFLVWFADNWKEIFTDVFNLTKTIFSNIGKNIWEFFTNIPGLIAGTTSFSEIWTPLTEGFEATVSEFPKIAARKEGEIEQALREQATGIREQLDKGFQEFAAGKIQEIEKKKAWDAVAAAFPDHKAAPDFGELAVDAATLPGEKDKTKTGKDSKPGDDNKAAMFGSSEAISAVQKLKFGSDADKDKQVKEQKTTNALLREQIAATNALAALRPARI